MSLWPAWKECNMFNSDFLDSIAMLSFCSLVTIASSFAIYHRVSRPSRKRSYENVRCKYKKGEPEIIYSATSPFPNFIDTLFTQCRSSVGVLNPSPLKTWPRCPPHAVQVISILVIPMALSSCLETAPGMASKNAGHPHPLSNLVVDLYSGVPQPAHVYTPSSLCLLYSPVPGRSVPFSRRTRNCSRDKIARHSLSDFAFELSAMGIDELVLELDGVDKGADAWILRGKRWV